MRICSLVPGATEIVVLLGLGDSLVGISHECNYPEEVRHVPVIVHPVVDSHAMSSVDIDAQIKMLASTDQPLYRVDERALAQARPDVIFSQDTCHVCAVTPDLVERAIQPLAERPRIVTLAPQSLSDVFDDVERIAIEVGAESAGTALTRSLRNRINAVRERAGGQAQPRVVCLEWLSPLYVGGHWIPEMIELAGGRDLLGQRGRPSYEISFEVLRDAAPDIVVVMPCGFSLSRTVSELTAVCRDNRALSTFFMSVPKVYAVDADSYFSRPGPRLVDGLELLADICSGRRSSSLSAGAVLDLTGNLPLSV